MENLLRQLSKVLNAIYLQYLSNIYSDNNLCSFVRIPT